MIEDCLELTVYGTSAAFSQRSHMAMFVLVWAKLSTQIVCVYLSVCRELSALCVAGIANLHQYSMDDSLYSIVKHGYIFSCYKTNLFCGLAVLIMSTGVNYITVKSTI